MFGKDPDSDNGIVISPRSVDKPILTSCFAKSRATTPLGVTLVNTPCWDNTA